MSLGLWDYDNQIKIGVLTKVVHHIIISVCIIIQLYRLCLDMIFLIVQHADGAAARESRYENRSCR